MIRLVVLLYFFELGTCAVSLDLCLRGEVGD